MSRPDIDDETAAIAFWRLVDHLQHRTDAQNIDLMALAGFCRNCLSDWVQEAAAGLGRPITKAEARDAVYGMPYEEWKDRFHSSAAPEQLARMQESLNRNRSQ
jgi:uncharacterized protein